MSTSPTTTPPASSPTPDWQNIADHGAVSGESKFDCSGAFANAIKAAGPGGTVYVPAGQWWIQNTVTTGPVNLVGDGWQSCIVPNVGAGNSAVVVNADPQGTSVDGLRWSGISILGEAIGGDPCCNYGLVIDTVTRSVFTDVHVLVAAASYGVYLCTGWSNTFNFTCSGNMAGDYAAAGIAAGLPAMGHILGDAGTSLGGLNANAFNCICEGGVATLLYIANQSAVTGAQGNNWITGTYQGTNPGGNQSNPPVALAIYAEGCYGLVIHDVHTEQTTGITLNNCTLPTVINTLTTTLLLEGSTADAYINQVHLDQLVIEPGCQYTRLGTLLGEGAGSAPGATNPDNPLIDQSATTVSLGSIDTTVSGYARNVRYTSSAPTNANNLVLNGDFSRWCPTPAPPGGSTSPTPDGWKIYGATVVQTGAGCSDLTTNLSANAACVTGTGSGPLFWYPLPAMGNQWLAASLYVLIPDAAPAQVELVLLSAGGDLTQQSSVVPLLPGVWNKLQAVFNLVGAATPAIGVMASGPGTFYIADVQAAVGMVAPSSSFVPAACAMPTLYLAGQSISYGSAAPTSGNCNVGDIVYNTAPAPGGWVGWVCTTASIPGPAVWTEFGQINSA
jgi:hypothetical protein